MSFYTLRFVDNAIERCVSARSWTSSSSDITADFNLTSRSCDPTRSSVRIPTRKIIHTTRYTDKRIRPKVAIKANEENCKSILAIETQSDIVPPLDLQSEENYPVTGDTFSYRKHCETIKIERKPELAYETWLSAKRKILSDEAARRRELEENKRQELEERKRISKEKYEKWLENKAMQQKQQQQHSQTMLVNETPSKQIGKPQILFSDACENHTSSQISDVKANARLDEWERTKRLQEERRRMKKRQEEQKRQQLEEQRRQAAAEAWNKWLAEAAKKPKPVPLNRGIFTLRGTISDIFVNPNEWKPILPNTYNAKGDH